MIGIGKGIEPISAMSCISFHSTKNINAGGEGGALLINDSSLLEKAWNIRDKGTNRQNFLSGEVSKYQWTSKGGSHILGEPGCAILASQLLSVNEVNLQRQTIMAQYKTHLRSNFDKYGSVMFEVGSKTNGHISAVILENSDSRSSVIGRLKSMGISSVSHYEPLHLSPAAARYDCRISESGCLVSTKLSKSIIRLPVYLGLLEYDVVEICDKLVDSLNSTQTLI